MISLNYTTYNNRWGTCGISFMNIQEYAKVLGFLSNIEHYKNTQLANKNYFSNSIKVCIEENNKDGAYKEEYRIYYYKDESLLSMQLPNLYSAKSAGIGSATCRINSELYIKHLINDFNFNFSTTGYIKDVFPPNDIDILSKLIIYMLQDGYSGFDIISSGISFINGFNL